MVGNRNHPLGSPHYDDITLKEYVLGQLLPDQEETIRQHLALCASCRARVAEFRAECRQIKTSLQDELDRADPSPRLSFDKVASEWRKPPRRVSVFYRVQQLIPQPSSLVLLALLVTAFLLVMPPGDSAALRSLSLVEDYNGPPSVVAAATEDGLAILRLADGQVDVVSHQPYMSAPRHLRLSPDGRWLALQQADTLHIIETIDDGAHHRFDLAPAADWSWSPDGQLLAYTDGTGQLAVFDVVSSTRRVLVPAAECAWGMPVWTDDGTQLAYAVVMPLPTEGDTPRVQSLWRVDPASGFRVELARNSNPDQALLVPAAWVNDDMALLAWDINAGAIGNPPTLHLVDVAAHRSAQLPGQSLAQGTHLAWPVSSDDIALALHRNKLVFLNLADGTRQYIPDQLPRPHNVAWAPNGAWLAYTVSSVPEGEGLYLFALQEGELRQVDLPDGATEKSVIWADPEHLFVIRQPSDSDVAELWLVSLTTGAAPQRIMTQVSFPQTGQYAGWQWGDVLAIQTLP